MAIFALSAFFIIFAQASSNADNQSTNLALAANGAKVYASSSPNPAWPASQVNDGLFDINHGWLASADEDSPWLVFEFDSPKTISSIVIYQAGLTEGGPGRFARPKTVSITTDAAEPEIFTLEDLERAPQKVEFDSVTTSMVKIDILDTYQEARFKFLTGFQEIEIYPGAIKAQTNERTAKEDINNKDFKETKPPVSSVEPLAVKKTISSAANVSGEKTEANSSSGAISAISDGVKKEFEDNGIDEEEREILELLKLLTKKLEAYMMKK